MSAVVPAKRKFPDLLAARHRTIAPQPKDRRDPCGRSARRRGSAVERGAPSPHDRRPVIQDLDQVGVEVISRERVDVGAAGT
jgi:hypothetical protein